MRFLILSAVTTVLLCGNGFAQQNWQVSDPSQSRHSATETNAYYAAPKVEIPGRIVNHLVKAPRQLTAAEVPSTNATAESYYSNGCSCSECMVANSAGSLPGLTVVNPPKNCWQNRLAKTGEYRDPNSTLPIPFGAKLARAYGCNKRQLDIDRDSRDQRFFFGVDPSTCCDEWDLFAGCGGLKANPGHWGRPWIRAADDVCMECRYCRCKKNHRERKAYQRGESCGCEECGGIGQEPSISDDCSTCDSRRATSARVAELFESADKKHENGGLLGKFFKN
jgi:hypothetical protein